MPFLLPNTYREAPRAVSVLVNQLWLGTFLSAEAKQRGTAHVCSSQPPKQGGHIQIPCWARAPDSAGSCLGKVLVGTGQIRSTDCSNNSPVQTLVLQCLGIVPAKLEFNCRAAPLE